MRGAIQLRAEGAGLVGEDFIFDLRAVCVAVEMPGCLVHLADGERLPGGVLALTQFTYCEKSRTW